MSPPSGATIIASNSIWNIYDLNGGAVTTNTVFFGDWTGKVGAIDKSDGTLLWHTATLFGGRSVQGLAVNDSNIIAGFSANRFDEALKFSDIVILDPATGTETDRFSSALAGESTFDSVETYSLLINSFDDIFAMLRLRDSGGNFTQVLRKFSLDGTHEWSVALGGIGYIPNAIAFNGDGNIVATDSTADQAKFRILDFSTGSEIFAATSVGGRLDQAESAALATDEGFYLGVGIGTHVERYNKDGGLIWSTEIYDPGTNAHTSVSVSALPDGSVFAQGDAFSDIVMLDIDGNILSASVFKSAINFETMRADPAGDVVVITADFTQAEQDIIAYVASDLPNTLTESWRVAEADLSFEVPTVIRFGNIVT